MASDFRIISVYGMKRRRFLKIGAAAALAAPALVRGAAAQGTIELKVSMFPPPANGAVKVVDAWGQALTEKTGDQVSVALFPSSQMGPPNRQYDLVRDGVADISWVLHGFTPGRFPLMDVANLPNLFRSTAQGTETMRKVRQPLVAEHEGVKVLALVASDPLLVMTNEKQVRSVADFNGLRVRPPSAVAAGAIHALGGTSAAVPPAEMGEALAKGVIDAIATTREAALSFKLFETVRYLTDLNFGVATFALVMNPAAYDRLSDEVKEAVDSTSGEPLEAAFVKAFEQSNEAAIAAAQSAGVENIELEAASKAEFDVKLAEFNASFVQQTAGKGVANALEVYDALAG